MESFVPAFTSTGIDTVSPATQVTANALAMFTLILFLIFTPPINIDK